MDELARLSLIEERKTNSAIRSAMSPKAEEVDPAAAFPVEELALDEEAVSEEGLTISSKIFGDSND